VALTSRSAADDALSALVGDPAAFLRDHWERRPLHRHSSIDAGRLLSVDAIDELVTSSALLWPVQIRLAKGGEILDPGLFTAPVQFPGMTDPPLVADPAAVIDQFVRGASILVQGMQRIWPPISELCSSLDSALTHATTVTAFLTPPFAQGLPRHSDPYEVFVIQVSGRKRWALHAPDANTPAEGGVDDRADRGAPDLIAELEPNDVLYLPRGWLHSAESLEDAALHISIMVSKRRWADVLDVLMAQLVKDPAFQEPLPAGYAVDTDAFAAALQDRLHDLVSRLHDCNVGDVARKVADEFWTSRRPSRRGELLQALAVQEIDVGTVVRGRSGTPLRVVEGAGSATVLRGHRATTLPLVFGPTLRRLTSGAPVVVGDLASHACGDLRLPLVRQLVREGHCEVVSSPAGG
jgi:ribosomal protein L16 Arg81 hydroxylase